MDLKTLFEMEERMMEAAEARQRKAAVIVPSDSLLSFCHRKRSALEKAARHYRQRSQGQRAARLESEAVYYEQLVAVLETVM